MDHVDRSMRQIHDDPRFVEARVLHHVFERTLDASAFIEVTRTYGGERTDEQYEAIATAITEEFGGSVTKVEDAALYTWKRRES